MILLSELANLKKSCLVCGDETIGEEYGAKCCESCKGFFRRAVERGIEPEVCIFKTIETNKPYYPCEITKYNRFRCQDCRYKKCLNVGMKKELVLQDKLVPLVLFDSIRKAYKNCFNQNMENTLSCSRQFMANIPVFLLFCNEDREKIMRNGCCVILKGFEQRNSNDKNETENEVENDCDNLNDSTKALSLAISFLQASNNVVDKDIYEKISDKLFECLHEIFKRYGVKQPVDLLEDRTASFDMLSHLTGLEIIPNINL